jgi:integrase
VDNQKFRPPLNARPFQRNVTADQRAEKNVARFLEKVGPSRAVERFLSGYGRVRTRSAYIVELVEYKRWLAKEGVDLGWDELPRDNLRRIFESGPTEVDAKRTHMDWLRRYLNVYLIGRGYSEAKRKLASAAVRLFYEANDSPLFGHLKEAEQRPQPVPKPLEADDIRKVLQAMPARFRTPLLVEWQSGIEINRVLETDWSPALAQAPPARVELVGRKRHRKPYFTFIGRESWEHIGSLRKGMPSYYAVTDNLRVAVRRLSGAGQLKNGDLASWHPHAFRHSFKTEAEHAEAKSGVVEYFMGHVGGIQWVYNHRAEVHAEDFAKEYQKIEPYVSLHPGEVQIRESYEEREQALLKRVVTLEERLERMVSGRTSGP